MMIRAFVALILPDEVCDQLAGLQAELPAGRIVPRENLHVTLAFIGRQPEPLLAELDLTLAAIAAPALSLRIEGVGGFGPGPRPRSIHAVLRPDPALDGLRRKVENAARGLGIALPARRFVPHVTLARPRAGRVDPPRLERALAAAMDFRLGPFTVHAFALYQSLPGREGPVYEVLASYPLGRDGAAPIPC